MLLVVERRMTDLSFGMSMSVNNLTNEMKCNVANWFRLLIYIVL